MLDPKESASEAGLRYVTDQEPGYRRQRRGKGFVYLDEAKKTRVKDEKIITRIKALVIPPAWESVWICRSPNGHLQVTGFDIKGRKQYRYHEKWSLRRNEAKFTTLIELGNSLPKLRGRIEHDLALAGLPREKVIAAVIKVMLLTHGRVGNSAYAIENESYGLTTLLNNHAEVKGSKVTLAFKGKSGVEHDISFTDARLSRIISRCQELPGEELFCYLGDDGEPVDINSGHVNDYLKSVTGKDFTAKDLRTWGGTCTALKFLLAEDPREMMKERQWKKRHLEVIRSTAKKLKNTVSVCRKYYIHPLVFEADQGRVLPLLWKSSRACKNFGREERLLLRLLEEVEELREKKAA